MGKALHSITAQAGAEKIWENSFKLLKAESHDHPVLLTEHPFNPKNNREKILQIMFETFNVPLFNLSLHSLMALYR